LHFRVSNAIKFTPPGGRADIRLTTVRLPIVAAEPPRIIARRHMERRFPGFGRTINRAARLLHLSL
jgi:hypothetical protein